MSLEIRTLGERASQHITADSDVTEVTHMVSERLDIACGLTLQPGWTGMDVADVKCPEGAKYIHHNVLSFPWPFEDNSIYEARCPHFVEHIPHTLVGSDPLKNGLVLFMEELYRVMMPQGIVNIMCPYWTSQRAWQDPTHVRAITENTFKYFDPQWAASIGVGQYGFKTDFEILTTQLILEPEYEAKSEAAKQNAIRHFVNVVMDLNITMRKRK